MCKWEIYDDQDAVDFAYLEYRNLKGESVKENIADNLAKQAARIKRENGRSTEIKLYRKERVLA